MSGVGIRGLFVLRRALGRLPLMGKRPGLDRRVQFIQDERREQDELRASDTRPSTNQLTAASSTYRNTERGRS